MLICISRQLAVVLLLVGSKVKDSGVIQLMLQNAIQGKIFWWGEAWESESRGESPKCLESGFVRLNRNSHS